MNTKTWLKKYIIPERLMKWVRPYYHGLLAMVGNIYFGFPSNKLVVIGVTGTNGKTTTVNLIAKILEQSGKKVGYTSTVNINISGRERFNTFKMTMPSGWLLHKWMKQMVRQGCQYAVLEISSEGLAQNRHAGINFDVAVFTNLTPEHIESHDGFDNYKKAKGKLFATLHKNPVTVEKKAVNPKLQKTIVTNSDDDHAAYYASFPAAHYITYGIKSPRAEIKAQDVSYNADGVRFTVALKPFELHLKGQFDVYNALAALAATGSLGVSLESARTALEKVSVVPGRVEVVTSSPFTVVVDYAYEPEEMRQLYETVQRWPHRTILQVLGPTGGGRDSARIRVLGEMAGKTASKVFITTDDPYDEDPRELAQGMIAGATSQGKILGKDLFFEIDRAAAIGQALHAAEPGDIVLITGKGADQKMALADGHYIDWDDRKVVRESLRQVESIK